MKKLPNVADNAVVYYSAALTCCFIISVIGAMRWPSLLFVGVIGCILFAVKLGEWVEKSGKYNDDWI